MSWLSAMSLMSSYLLHHLLRLPSSHPPPYQLPRIPYHIQSMDIPSAKPTPINLVSLTHTHLSSCRRLPADFTGVCGQAAVLTLAERREDGGVRAQQFVAVSAPEGQFRLAVHRHQAADVLDLFDAALHRVTELFWSMVFLSHKDFKINRVF